MATVEVVPPSICNEVEIGTGISTPIRENRAPKRIARIKGFLDSLIATFFILSHFWDFSRLYNSKIVRDAVTLNMAIKAAEIVANRSPSVGKANVMKGMPKKATLPKMVLKIKRYIVFFWILNMK